MDYNKIAKKLESALKYKVKSEKPLDEGVLSDEERRRIFTIIGNEYLENRKGKQPLDKRMVEILKLVEPMIFGGHKSQIAEILGYNTWNELWNDINTM